MIEVLDIGDCVETGSYRLHSRFRGALAFTGEASGRLVCAVDENKCAGPWNIVTRGLDFARADSLAVDDEAVWFDGEGCPIGRRSDSRLQTGVVDTARLGRNLELMWATLCECAPERSIVRLLTGAPGSGFDAALADRFRSAIARLSEGDVGAAGEIRGVGPGLTPAGDDFLAGYLLGLCVAGDGFAEERRAIREMARTGNPFSSVMLDCAVEGRAIEPVREVMRGLLWRRHSCLPHRDSSRCAADAPHSQKRVETSLDAAGRSACATAVRRLCLVGASSGADMACGLYFGLDGFVGQAASLPHRKPRSEENS